MRPKSPSLRPIRAISMMGKPSISRTRRHGARAFLVQGRTKPTTLVAPRQYPRRALRSSQFAASCDGPMSCYAPVDRQLTGSGVRTRMRSRFKFALLCAALGGAWATLAHADQLADIK